MFGLRPKSELAKYIKISCNLNRIILRHGHIAITNYTLGDNWEFERYLSIFDASYYCYQLIGGYYVERFREMRVNRGIDIGMLRKFFPNHSIYVDNYAYPRLKEPISLIAPPKDKFQMDAIKFIACKGKYAKNIKFSQQIIDADTGKGKTYLGVCASVICSGRTIIFVPKNILMDIWKNSYMMFSDVKESEILFVKGSKKCEQIRYGEFEDIKVFIFSIDTFLSYLQSYGELATMEMLKKTRCTLKIIDEFHLDMVTCAKIEALSNFRLNLYMSASPGRSESRENRVFNNLFSGVPRLSKSVDNSTSDHINVVIKNYDFIPTSEEIRKMVSPTRGLNGKLYESILMDSKPPRNESFVKALLYMLQLAKGNLVENNKILILAGTIKGINKIMKIAELVFGDGECSVYYSKLKQKEKEKALKKRVIVATDNSLGTGADIKGVQYVFNVVTYTSKIGVIQYSGRGRKLNNAKVVYVEFVNVGYHKTFMQYMKREPYLRKRSRGEIQVIK